MPKVFREMVQHESVGGIILVAAALLAIAISNSPLWGWYQNFLAIPISIEAGTFSIDKQLVFWVNDGLMAIFFFLIGLEVKRELLDGHLKSKDQIMLPAIGALAGIATPALIYTFFNINDSNGIRGWAIPAATDIAFALGVLSLFGKRVPTSLKLFLLSFAIFDDIAAIIIIALFYSNELAAVSLLIATVGLAVLVALNYFGVRHQSLYILVGIIVWASVLKSGVHATLAGFAVALTIPLTVRNFNDDPMLKAMEHNLQPWVAFIILPLFAFSNAGVNLFGVTLEEILNPITVGIMLGLFLGNQFGIFGICWVTIKLGLARLPKGATWQQFYGVAALGGIGFTMSLFIGTLAFEQFDPAYLDSVKIGVLGGSLLSALLGSFIIYQSLTQKTAQEASYEMAKS